MGYYTRYNLKLLSPSGAEYSRIESSFKREEVVAAATAHPLDYGDGEFVASLLDNNSDDMKWYGYDENMRELSKLVPGVLFKLHGEGEETGDLWDAYYLDGKGYKQHAEIVIPSFNAEKLS